MILLSHHLYKNKHPKDSRYINTIMPQNDREVPQRMFDCFEDTTPQHGILVIEEHGENVLRDILLTTGADQ